MDDAAIEIAQAARLSQRSEFVQRYTHPFLLLRVDPEGDDAEFKTAVLAMDMVGDLSRAGKSGLGVAEGIVVPLRKRPNANAFSFITIGRASNNDVIININAVSKCHAVFNQAGDSFSIADAGSKNGTIVNGKKLERDKPVVLGNGDMFSLSHRVLVTFLDADAAYTLLTRDHS